MTDPVISMAFKPTEFPISPLIFGHFIEFIENCMIGGVYDPDSPASDEKGIRQDVLEKAKGLRPAILRWPGGTFANTYHWMDAIGPLPQRRKRKNLIWGGIVDNAFGTAEFIQYCRALGAEPMLCVNMASGTAQEAAEWVEYCNGPVTSEYGRIRVERGHPEPYNVKFWSLGNEIGYRHMEGRLLKALLPLLGEEARGQHTREHEAKDMAHLSGVGYFCCSNPAMGYGEHHQD